MRFGKHKKVKKREVAENSVALNEEDRVRAAMEAQYKRKPKPFYFRKNLRVASAGVQSIFLLPRRLRRGPIYPSYSKRLEVYYRSVMKVADHHFMLSWEDLRNLYPIPRTPKDSYVRKVTLPCGLRGEFVCWVDKREARKIKKQEKEYERLKAQHEKDGGDLPEESPFFRNKPTIYFIHGGGFCIGTVPSYRTWCWKLSKLLGGMQFFLIDYTLSPEVTFPVALKQCWRAYLWLLNPTGGGIPSDRLIIAGDSAGGNLTLSLLYVIRQVRLEKERSELRSHRERRLSLSSSSTAAALRRSSSATAEEEGTRNGAQQQRQWEKGPVEQWIEKEREREDVAMSAAVEKVLQCRQKAKELADTNDDKDDGDGESDAAAADKSSERRWPACNMTESQHRAWERRTLASDDKFMLKHKLPFELAENERDIFPPMPLAAILLSPWVDLRSYPSPERFRPYHIGLRFVQGYLNLQPTDYPFTKRKERELRRPLTGGLKAQQREKYAKREKDRARIKWEKKRWERKYLKSILYEELRQRQVDRDERQHNVNTNDTNDDESQRRRRDSAVSLREEEQEAELERSGAYLRHGSRDEDDEGDEGVGASDGTTARKLRRRGSTLEEERLRQRRQSRAGMRSEEGHEEMTEEGVKERNKTSIYSPYISPVYGDLLGLPPLMITGGDVEPLWEDIRTVHKKAVEHGVDVELYVGHHMNHDFQFFFNVMPHPEVQRFFEHVKDWLHQRMNMREEREAGLVRQHSLAPAGTGLVDERHPDHALDNARAEVVDAGRHEEKERHHNHHERHHEEEFDVPPPAPPAKEAEPESARLIDEQMSKRPTTEEPTYHHHPNKESLPGLAAAVDDDAVAVSSSTATRRLSTGEGEVKVTVLAGKPTSVIDDGLYARFDDEEADGLAGVYATRTPPYPV